MSIFQPAVREKRKLRAAIDGPAGAGKTFSLLRLAFSMKAAGLCSKIAIIDTENNSASLYVGEAPDDESWGFETLNLKQYNPDQFTYAIKTAEKEGFDCVIIDSLSHAWIGQGGALDIVDQKTGNRFAAWKDVTPLHRTMVDSIIQSGAHVLVSMRSKTEYVLEDETNRDGKITKVPRKIGVAPVQRDGMEYEFDIYGSMDWSHQLKITKSRCSPMDGKTTVMPGPAFWAPLFDWLKSGTAAKPRSVEFSKNGETKPTSEQSATVGTMPPQEYLQQFHQRIDEAKTEEELKATGLNIRNAIDNKLIGDAENSLLKTQYKEKLAKLRESKSG